MIGQTISHYKILEKLGEGGMGVVYKVEDTRLDRIVALKFLPSELTRDPEAKERFTHEAKAASALSHPNICSIHTIEEFEGKQFLDLEFVEGKTLGVLLKEKELSLREVVDIAIQIAEGLNAAHKRGIIHRDIKPDNIMVTNEGLVKIMDFGLAKLKGSSKLTKTHSTLGTLSYMSPEQARGEEVDQRSDIFSFGAVLYEMITGRRPFKGEHEVAIMYSLMNEAPEPLARYKTSVPDVMQRIVDKALSKERGERYQHVDEMIADLRRVQHTISDSVQSKIKKTKAPWIIATVAVVLVAICIYFFYPKSGLTLANSKTIAVLPFNNMSGNQEDEYFSDGITEDILTQLSKISDLNVISRTTIMQYKGTKKPLKEIGNELNAGVILEGSVRRSGDRVRISSQLIDAATDKHIWAENYDREMKDVFTIQSDVAQRIATALKVKLNPIEKERIEKKQTENTEAYQLYLKGRFSWNKRTAADLQRAIDYFNQAIEKDSNYAQAYAGLASSYVLVPEYYVLSKEAIQNARTAARKALEFDPANAEAHTVFGLIKFKYDWDWDGAETEFKYAIELDQSYPTAHQWYYTYLISMNRKEEALAEIKRAHELDPLSLVINVNYGDAYFFMRQYDRAVEQFQRTIELDSNFLPIYASLGQSYQEQGKFDKAIAAFQKYRILGGSEPDVKILLGYIYGLTGKKGDAHKMLNDLIEFHKQGYLVTYNIAWLYIGLGDKDKTFEWLEKAYQEHDLQLFLLNIDPYWDSLRSEPRFIALLKKMGLKK